ncbi:MAG: hypothetical protein JXR77_03825, partial [Lentisphaeria bacterium]|nr:hypothetical protein [Lentisphaeria bacterium]
MRGRQVRHDRRKRPPGRRLAALVCLAGPLVYARLLLDRVLFASDTFPYALPQKTLLREAWAATRVPALNPYVICGTPLLENIAEGALYPLNLLLLPGAPLWGYHLFVTGHYCLATLGFWLFCRHGLRARPWACATGAVAYVAGGYLWSMADHLFFQAGTWIPFYLLGLLIAARHPRRWGHGTALAGGALTMLFTGGNFQQACDTVVFGALLTCVLAWRPGSGFTLRGSISPRPWSRRARGTAPDPPAEAESQAIPPPSRQATPTRPALLSSRAVTAFLLSLAASLALAAPQLLPTLFAARQSYRAGGLGLPEASAWSFPPLRLLEYAWPFFYGHRQEFGSALGRFYEGHTAWAQAVFVGIPPLVGCGLLLTRRRWRRETVFLGLVLALGLLLALGRYTPLYGLAYHVVPGFGLFRHPEKYLLWVHVALLAGGAMGLSALERDPRLRRRGRILSVALAAAFGVGLVALAGSAAFPGGGLAEAVRSMGSAWSRERLLGWQLGHGIAASLAAGWLAWVLRPPRAGHALPPVGPTACLLTVAHLLLLTQAVRWTIPRDWLAETTPAAKHLPARDQNRFRLYTDPACTAPQPGRAATADPHAGAVLGRYARMAFNTPALFRWHSVHGYSALCPAGYIAYTDFGTRHPTHVLGLLAARYVIVGPGVTPDALPPHHRILRAQPGEPYSILV